MGILNLMLNPQSYQLIQQSLQMEGKELKVGELFSRIISNSGITDWDKIVVDKTDDTEAMMGDMDAQFSQALQEVVQGQTSEQVAPNGQMDQAPMDQVPNIQI
jgi:K+-transporting ATPase A subunit